MAVGAKTGHWDRRPKVAARKLSAENQNAMSVHLKEDAALSATQFRAV